MTFQKNVLYDIFLILLVLQIVDFEVDNIVYIKFTLQLNRCRLIAELNC